MLRHRLILTLLMNNQGLFYNSRDFRLQAVGELDWIKRYINFDAIDELIVLNVDRNPRDMKAFGECIQKIGKTCFVPIAAGGGVSKIEDFDVLLDSGCDKVVINTAAFDNPDFVLKASGRYGSQCVVSSIDVLKNGPNWEVTVENGERETGVNVLEHAKKMENLGAGELYLTSIDQDGTGQGYDLDLVQTVVDHVSIPVIASGGVGDFGHLVDGIYKGRASAVSAANIFHHIGDSLKKAKQHIGESGVNVPMWNFWDGMEGLS